LKTSAIEFVDRSIQGMSGKNLLSIGTEGQLEVTKLGRATLKGTVDLDRVSAIKFFFYRFEKKEYIFLFMLLFL